MLDMTEERCAEKLQLIKDQMDKYLEGMLTANEAMSEIVLECLTE